MVSLKSELGGLIRIIRILGWLTVIVGVMGLFAVITTPSVGLTLKSLSRTIIALSGGILYLIIASGLSKKKRWAWYLGIVAFIYSAISNFIAGSMINIGAGVIALIFLALLLKGKKTIFEQPAEHSNISSNSI